MARQSKMQRWRREGEAMVARWERSGLSMAAYARKAGVPVRRLGLWRRRLAGERPDAAEHFLPVTVAPEGEAGVRLLLARGISVEVGSMSDLSLLRRVVDALTC
jgi:hypothetical protein